MRCRDMIGRIVISVFVFLTLFLQDKNVVQSLSLQNVRNEHSPTKFLILGLGRVGLDVAKEAIATATDLQVVGTVRQLNKVGNASTDDDIQRMPFSPEPIRQELFGSTDTEDTNVSVPATHVLFTIPLQREQDLNMEKVWNLVKEWWFAPPHPKQSASRIKVLGILSTTGVYGDHDGKVVTEESPLLCGPENNAYLYQQLEEEWKQLASDALDDDGDVCRRLFIFRCAGIYDSSRSALHTVYQKGFTPPSNATEEQANVASITNRIHSSDIARAVIAAMFTQDHYGKDNFAQTSWNVYNLADDEPERRSVVLSYAKDLLLSIGCDVPSSTRRVDSTKELKSSLSSLPSRSSQTRQSRRQRERKVVSNERMKKDLLPDGLTYPTYREGLKAILKDSSTPWQEQLKYKRANKARIEDNA